VGSASRGAELGRTCPCGLGGSGRGDDAEKLLDDSFGEGEGPGWSSGIAILLRCTVRLDGGVYAFGAGLSRLMRRSPTEG
jgi:hypothetical protein